MLAVLLLAGVFVSCQRGGDSRVTDDDTPAATRENGAPAIGGAEQEQEPEPEDDDLPPVIYYDLTRFEWYARGEPMRLEDGSYAPRGAPVRAATSEMQKIGEYEGVEYYERNDESDSEGVVYVPVFEGFWLPFARE